MFKQIEKAIDLLFTKCIRSAISYEGIHRIEKYEYPKDAVRETLLNAITHKDYSGGVPIHAILFVKQKGKINNSDYQILNEVSKATATRDLTELTETHKILKRTGDVGAGTNYILIGS